MTLISNSRGKLVEFVQPSDDPNKPHDTSLEAVAGDCRICVVRRREMLSNGHGYFSSSIWVFSDDRTVRFQQKCKMFQTRCDCCFSLTSIAVPENQEIIPFASYFQDEKVSITFLTEVVLHDIIYGTPALKIAKTSWVNFVFSNIADAEVFQSTLFGHTLLGSFKTERTMRIHEGLAAALTYQEQMCAMENLRIWQDENTRGIMMMIHFSAQFRSKGYLTCYLNSKDYPIKIKDDGGKVVKLKGLRIGNEEGDVGAKGLRRESTTSSGSSVKEMKRPEKEKKNQIITGAKIEFKNEVEKKRFLDVVKGAQSQLVRLPQSL
jgi:hypothetical protein